MPPQVNPAVETQLELQPDAPFSISYSSRIDTSLVGRKTFTPTPTITSTKAFVDWLLERKAVGTKTDSEVIVGALFVNGRRVAAELESSGISMIQLDYDKPQGATLDNVLGHLELLGAAAVGFDTFSSTPEAPRFTVLLPLARPCHRDEYLALMAQLNTCMLPYNTWSAESHNPVQARFVSPNAAFPRRVFYTNSCANLVVPPTITQAQQASNVSASVHSIIDPLSLIVSDDYRQLMLLALDNDLLPTSMRDSYADGWFAVVAATLRGFGVKKTDPAALEGVQRAAYDALVRWSARSDKHKNDRGAVAKQLLKVVAPVRADSAVLTVGGILHDRLTQEGADKLTQIILDNGMDALLIPALDSIRGTHFASDAMRAAHAATLKAAVTQSAQHAQTRADRIASENKVLHSMPDCLGKFRDLAIAVTSQGQVANHAALMAKPDYEFFISPIPMALMLAQIASLGFAPHNVCWMPGVNVIVPLQLDVLHIAGQGTGKSTLIELGRDVISKTSLARSYFASKVFSATGFWQGAFDRTGPLQMVMSEEAVKMLGHGARNTPEMEQFQTLMLELFDSKPGTRLPKAIHVKEKPGAQGKLSSDPTGPVVPFNLSGTPAILQSSLTDTQMTNGFMSRFITYIGKESKPKAKSERDDLYRKMIFGTGLGAGVLSTACQDMAEHLTDMWVKSSHPNAFMLVQDYSSDEEYNAAMTDHFDSIESFMCNQITANPKDEQAVIDLLGKHEDRFRALLKGDFDANSEAGVAGLIERLTWKLFRLSTIMSLIADPTTKHIDIDIMTWCEELLWLAQASWCEHLARQEDVAPKNSRYTERDVSRLMKALLPGGAFHKNGAMTTTQMNQVFGVTSPWRRLIRDLAHGNPTISVPAAALLHDLRVTRTKLDNGSTQFEFIPDT